MWSRVSPCAFFFFYFCCCVRFSAFNPAPSPHLNQKPLQVLPFRREQRHRMIGSGAQSAPPRCEIDGENADGVEQALSLSRRARSLSRQAESLPYTTQRSLGRHAHVTVKATSSGSRRGAWWSMLLRLNAERRTQSENSELRWRFARLFS